MGTRSLYWSRPKTPEHPHVWHTFDVKNNVSGELERFKIQDLPESKIEEALTFLTEILCKEEPMHQAYEMYNNRAEIENMKKTWRKIAKQKVALVCFKEGSDEIVGINMNYVQCIQDISFSNFVPVVLADGWNFLRNLFERMNIYHRDSQQKTMEEFHDIFQSMIDYDPFEHFGVNEYLSAGGLAVATKYRRRGIATELLKTREKFCKQFGIEMTLNGFSSDYANACADKAGFKLERKCRYKHIRRQYPNLPNIQSDALTVKFIRFPKSQEVAKGRFSLPTLSLESKCTIIASSLYLLLVFLMYGLLEFFLFVFDLIFVEMKK